MASDGLDFEILVADAYRRLGFRVRTTPRTGDGGVDVIAARAGKVLVVQCKHLSGDGAVGIADVQRLAGAQAQFGAVGSALVTTGRFTQAATQSAKVLGVILVGPSDLINMMIEGQRLPLAPESEAGMREEPDLDRTWMCQLCRRRVEGINHNGRCRDCNAG